MRRLPLLSIATRVRAGLVVAAVVAGALGPSTGSAQATREPSSGRDDEQQVIAVDDAYVAAEVAHDEAAIRRPAATTARTRRGTPEAHPRHT